MGNVVGIGGKIINPMATQILSLTIDDQHNVNLQCSAPPNMAIKLLQGVITDILVGMISNQQQQPPIA